MDYAKNIYFYAVLILCDLCTLMFGAALSEGPRRADFERALIPEIQQKIAQAREIINVMQSQNPATARRFQNMLSIALKCPVAAVEDQSQLINELLENQRRVNAQLKDLQDKTMRLERENEQLRGQQTGAARVARESDDLKKRLEEYQRQVTARELERDQAVAQIVKQEELLAQRAQLLQDAEMRLAETEKRSKEVDAQKKQITELQSQLTQAKQQSADVAKIQEQLQVAQNQLARVERQKREADEAGQKLKTENEQLKAVTQAAEKKNKEAEAQKKQIEELQGQLAQAQKQSAECTKAQVELKALQGRLSILTKECDQARVAEDVAKKALAAHEAHMKEEKAVLSQQAAQVEQLTTEKRAIVTDLAAIYNMLVEHVINAPDQLIQRDHIAGINATDLTARINDVVRELPRLLAPEGQQSIDMLNFQLTSKIYQIKIGSQVQIIEAYEKLAPIIHDLINETTLSQVQKKKLEVALKELDLKKQTAHTRAMDQEKNAHAQYEALKKELINRLTQSRLAQERKQPKTKK